MRDHVRPSQGRLLFAAEDAGGRLRRPVDGLIVLAAGVLFTGAAVVADVSESGEQDVVDAAATLLGWFDPGWRVAYTALLGYGVVVLVATLLTRRWRLLRDQLVAVAIVLAIGFPSGRIVRPDWPSLTEGLWEETNQYPALRLAAVVAVLVVAGPELTRTARIVAAWLVFLGGIGAVVLGIGYVTSVVGGVALGLAIGGLIRLSFGTSAGFPPPSRVLAGLAELDITANALTVSRRQRAGSATYTAVDPDGQHLSVVVLGRDAQDTQRIALMWRGLTYRDGGPDLATGRLQQIEHESLITLLADRAGAKVPAVRVAGVVASGDAILVMQQPDAPPAEESANNTISDAFLTDLWADAAALRRARLSHGALNLSNVLVTPDGPMIVRFNRGLLAASPTALDIDLAELLVSTSIVADPDRALSAALASVGPQAVTGALPYLQRAALTPHLRDLARHQEVNLDELRTKAAAATAVELPAIVPMRRFRLRDLLLTVLVGFAGYLIITQLAEIGFDTIGSELRQAEVGWVVIALFFSQLTFLTQAISLRGAVLASLPLQPCVALQSAIKFVNLTVPSSAGRIAVNIRFLQRQGVPTAEAVASGAVDSISDTLIQTVLVLALLPFVHFEMDLPSSGLGSTGGLILVLVAVLVIVVAVVLATPRWRNKVVPLVRDAWTSLVAVARTRSKRLELFGGNIATQVLFALTLGAAARAYGVDLTLAELLLVNMGASVFANIVPAPGGVGVAEAGLTAGLVALGVDQSTAFAIALTHRLCTYYLPPIWGYASLHWLNRKGYL